MKKELPTIEYIELDGSAVIVAGQLFAPLCITAKAWSFVFRATIPVKLSQFLGMKSSEVWFDWEIVPAVNNKESAIHELQKKALERSITKIEILWISDPAKRAELLEAQSNG